MSSTLKVKLDESNDYRNLLNSIYNGALPYMAWINASTDIETPYTPGKWHTCRETLTEELCRYCRNGFKKNGDVIEQKLKYQLSKMHVAFAFRFEKSTEDYGKAAYNNVLPGLHVLNIFENEMRLPKSRLRLVSAPGIRDKLEKARIGICAISSSKRWLKSTHLISFHLMLVRTGIVLSKTNINVNDLSSTKDVVDVVEKLSSDMAKGVIEKSYWQSYVNNIKLVLRYTDIITNDHDFIFSNKDAGDKLRNIRYLSRSSGSFGISHLLVNSGRADNTATSLRFPVEEGISPVYQRCSMSIIKSRSVTVANDQQKEV